MGFEIRSVRNISQKRLVGWRVWTLTYFFSQNLMHQLSAFDGFLIIKTCMGSFYLEAAEVFSDSGLRWGALEAQNRSLHHLAGSLWSCASVTGEPKRFGSLMRALKSCLQQRSSMILGFLEQRLIGKLL